MRVCARAPGARPSTKHARAHAATAVAMPLPLPSCHARRRIFAGRRFRTATRHNTSVKCQRISSPGHCAQLDMPRDVEATRGSLLLCEGVNLFQFSFNTPIARDGRHTRRPLSSAISMPTAGGQIFLAGRASLPFLSQNASTIASDGNLVNRTAIQRVSRETHDRSRQKRFERRKPAQRAGHANADDSMLLCACHVAISTPPLQSVIRAPYRPGKSNLPDHPLLLLFRIIISEA